MTKPFVRCVKRFELIRELCANWRDSFIRVARLHFVINQNGLTHCHYSITIRSAARAMV